MTSYWQGSNWPFLIRSGIFHSIWPNPCNRTGNVVPPRKSCKTLIGKRRNLRCCPPAPSATPSGRRRPVRILSRDTTSSSYSTRRNFAIGNLEISLETPARPHQLLIPSGLPHIPPVDRMHEHRPVLPLGRRWHKNHASNPYKIHVHMASQVSL